MNEHTTSAEKLERVLHQTLRGAAMRRAPATLESRVFAELERRAALPWWRSSFAYWPAMARVAFVLMCASLVVAMLLGGISAFVEVRSFGEIEALLLSWTQPLTVVLSSAGGLTALLARVIPPFWLYGGLAFGVLMYVLLFGLGAAAYRTLYLRPIVAGE
ncbi:MAG TPA: hypothetical protein VGI65_16110 [Steroidobacteraceae bacterium]|jgi:hypothetical protein